MIVDQEGKHLDVTFLWHNHPLT